MTIKKDYQVIGEAGQKTKGENKMEKERKMIVTITDAETGEVIVENGKPVRYEAEAVALTALSEINEEAGKGISVAFGKRPGKIDTLELLLLAKALNDLEKDLKENLRGKFEELTQQMLDDLMTIERVEQRDDQ